ncbi:rh94 [macacine betaherpesvirus 3]|uniref:Rh94 n=1 Tax=Rhesus cytomegalovirus (strain 68-1) TaxID=47929 RepID=Q7TFP0_RHCM6|nr:rh94 [macacine betaherpesvirus 3]AAP50620.1 rh94 [macacine betaherpesvirus 3]
MMGALPPSLSQHASLYVLQNAQKNADAAVFTGKGRSQNFPELPISSLKAGLPGARWRSPRRRPGNRQWRPGHSRGLHTAPTPPPTGASQPRWGGGAGSKVDLAPPSPTPSPYLPPGRLGDGAAFRWRYPLPPAYPPLLPWSGGWDGVLHAPPPPPRQPHPAAGWILRYGAPGPRAPALLGGPLGA